jgi:hypothetical protein
LSLASTFEWKHGGVIYSGSNGILNGFGMTRATEDRESTFIFAGYRADGTPNDIARGGPNDPLAMQTLYSGIMLNVTESYIFSNSFVKLREIALNYTFPRSIIPRADVSVSAFARNILLWSELPNIDPETSQGNNNMAGGFERFSLPQVTSFGLGLNVTF